MMIKGSQLPALVKEFGYEIDAEYVYFMPGAHASREGLFKNGKMEECWNFDLDFILRFLKDITEFDLPARLKERGYNIDIRKQKYFPYEFKDGKYGYDIEKSITFLKAVTRYNLEDLLREKGYDIDDDYLKIIIRYCGEYSKENFSYYNLEKVIAFINSTNEYNLPAKLKEHGFETNASDIKRITKQYLLRDYHTVFQSFDLEKVILYLKTNPKKDKIMNMKKQPEVAQPQTDNQPISFFGVNSKDYYTQVGNLYSRFPISKWYAEKYNTIPDVCFIGQIYIDDLLDEDDYKIRWSFKNLTDYENINSSVQPTVLRAFENEQKREIMVEALIEIEDGMFLLLVDGRFDRENETMYATAILFYKEGIHDPTDMLLYVSDKYVVHYETGTLGLLYHDQNGFNTHDFTIPRPNINFNLHYNHGFEQVHNTIWSALCREKGKGLVLLHGKPGTGKTTYIRYLINMLNKNKIFVPPNLTELLSDPGFIPFLMNNPNSILFVEDAENVLRSREDKQNNQAVSNVLNITDGLLSDCLNIQIVATFNTHLRNIDEALLRKGRLIAQYEFTSLKSDRAEKLADSLKIWLDDTSDLTLADVYAAQPKTI